MSCVYHKLAEYMISLKSIAEARQGARAGGGETEGPLGGNCTQRFSLEQVQF